MVCSSCNGRGWHGNTSDCKCLRCGGTGEEPDESEWILTIGLVAVALAATLLELIRSSD